MIGGVSLDICSNCNSLQLQYLTLTLSEIVTLSVSDNPCRHSDVYIVFVPMRRSIFFFGTAARISSMISTWLNSIAKLSTSL